MAHSRKSTRYQEYQNQLRNAMRTQFPAVGLPLCSSDRRVRWTDRILATALVLLSWHGAATLREAFAATREAVIAMYPTRRRPGVHLEGFLKAWQKRSATLLKRIVDALRKRTVQQSGAQWRWKQWVVLGVDGSRINCPRTRANEEAFGCAGKQKTTPQQLLVTLFHVASGLPWAWRRARGDASERGLLRTLLGEMPEHTLLLADAGFTGYDLLWTLQEAGHAFVVRAGRNVSLLRKLGYELRERRGTVYLWPTAQRDRPPLVLRLVTVRTERRRVALLTNVHDEAVLSDGEVAALYRQRWTIEVMFRSLKQTLGKRAMHCEAPALAQCELDWAMVGLWLLGLMTLAETGLRRGWSAARAVQVVRRAMRNCGHTVGARELRKRLRGAHRDTYTRRGPKQARNWPHKKTESPPGEPKIRMATDAEIKAAQRFKENQHAA